MKFGSRLRELRRSQKLNQGELAKELNISQQQISCYESGQSTPDAEFLNKVANYFDVTTDYLSGRVDEKVTDEQRIILSYRKLPPAKKQLATQMIKLLETSEDENE